MSDAQNDGGDRREYVYVEALGREVAIRPGTSDEQVLADTFTGLYHLPPAGMPTPLTVLDLGANIGLTAAHYKALWPNAEIVAVELDAASTQIARMNARMLVRNYAIADWNGVGFYDPTVPAEAFSVRREPRRGDRRVQCLTLRKAIIRTFAGLPVDFCKMDVEGMEWRLFDVGGEWAGLVRRLLVELHEPDSWPRSSPHHYPAEVLIAHAVQALERLGYRARPHGPHPQAVYAER